MYISVNDAATKFNISKRRVQILCEQGRIAGANMVSGVWLIPETSTKPEDKRKKAVDVEQLSLFDESQQPLSANDVCRELSISYATIKNWIRLGKITPDVGDQCFSREYISQFLEELKSIENKKLKSRRNKRKVSGKLLYKDYVDSSANQELVVELLDLNVIENHSDLLIILANFSVQLYYQSRKMAYSNNNVLLDYLSDNHTDDFFKLVQELLDDSNLDSVTIKRLSPALSKHIQYIRGEDSLGLVYISLQDVGQRKRSGSYFTPVAVVNRLIDELCENVDDLSHKTLCDPCCGTGNFLITLASKGVACSNLYGQDIDPTCVHLSRINLALIDPLISAKDICSRVIIGNTLFETFAQRFDVILGNPPWGSALSEADISKYQVCFKTAVGKSIDSYDLFVEKTLSMLNSDGFLAFVLPEALLNVAAHDSVRKLILNSCSFRFVNFIGNVFSGVQCPAIILGIALNGDHTAIGCSVTNGDNRFVISYPRKFDDGMITLNVSDEEKKCLDTISSIKNAVYLKDNARFALGIVTGSNKDYIFSEKRDDCEIVLKGSDIQKYGIETPENYIRFLPKSFQQVAPIEAYRAKEKLLYRFICEVPVFAYDNEQRLTLNSCNIVIPEIDGINMKYVLAILNSSVAAFYFSKRFNSVKLLRSHIEQMPIPMVSAEVQERIIRAVDTIMNSTDNTMALYSILDNTIMDLFALNDEQIKTIRSSLNGKNLFLKKN